jgi:hypothetical protein
MTQDAGSAGIGSEQDGQDPDRGGLAHAVRPEKRDGFTARDGKVEAANGSDLTVRLGQGR